MRVAMLTQNEWRIDSRVAREASALAAAGHEVHVVCRTAAPTPVTEEVAGVTYHSIPRLETVPWQALAPLASMHLRVLLLDASYLRHGPRRGARVVSALEVPLIAIAALLGAPLALLLHGIRAFRPRVAMGLVEAWVYLNEFGLSCGQALDALEPEAVHAHDLVTLSTAVRVGKKRKCPVVYDAHELETETNYTFTAVTTREVVRYERALAPCAARIVTVSESIARWIMDVYRVPPPVLVLNAPEESNTRPSSDVRTAAGVSSSVQLAVYVGSVTIDRGLEQCVEALSYAPGFHLATVGPRYEVTESALIKLARTHGVDDRLHFVDAVAADSVTQFVATATCSVVAIQATCLSYTYCLPNKLLESVFARLPVVVSDLPEMRRFVESTGTGLVVDATSPPQIAEALEEIAANRDLYRPTPERLDALRREYGWPAQRARLAALYERLRDREVADEEFAEAAQVEGA